MGGKNNATFNYYKLSMTGLCDKIQLLGYNAMRAM